MAPALKFLGTAVFTCFSFYPYSVWDFCLSASPPRLFLPFPAPPPHRDSSVKEVSCHQLGMWVLTVPDRNLFDVLPRLTFHQIPGLGVFFPSSQRPVR